MKDDEKRLVDFPFVDYNSDVDDVVKEASGKVRNNVHLRIEGKYKGVMGKMML